MNPWDHLPSIWDGWEKQCFGVFHVESSHCALGFLETAGKLHLEECFLGRVAHFDDPEVRRRAIAVELYLACHGLRCIGFTNDSVRWTPEQFRDLDRRLEYEYQQAQLARQVDQLSTVDNLSSSAAQPEQPCSIPVAKDSLVEDGELVEV